MAEVAIVQQGNGLGAHPHPASLDNLRRFREMFTTVCSRGRMRCSC